MSRRVALVTYHYLPNGAEATIVPGDLVLRSLGRALGVARGPLAAYAEAAACVECGGDVVRDEALAAAPADEIQRVLAGQADEAPSPAGDV